ncbi:MAG: 4Fe-4S dicluster domain-containing protein [Negativicutes bacterium]|nr:4Fe-4S dicluster domain-containing protein [Negativicutes bacterium]
METSFSQKIMAKSQQNINLCYQCKKCAAGCPVSDIMDYQNYQLLRLIQSNQQDVVLTANTPWVCLSCKTCSVRCPNGIDIARVLDVVKEQALAAGSRIPERKMAVFNAAFLEMIRRFGRAFEMGLFGIYKMKTGTFFQDARLGLEFMKRGKLSFLPHRIKGSGEVRRIFARMKENRE